MFGPCRRRGNQGFRTGAILLWVALLASATYAQDVQPLPDWQVEAQARKGRGKLGRGVEEAVDARGSVRVVVTLQRPQSLRRLEQSRFDEIKRDIEASQNAVLGALTPGGYSLNRRYRLVPAFAATMHSRAALDRLANHPMVAGIDLDGEVRGGLGDSVPLIRADSMHARGYTGEGLIAAVLDSGIDTDHPDLVDDLIHEECFLSDPVCHNGLPRDSGPGSAEDDEGHGTHIAGTITSSGTVSSVGVAPDVQIIAMKVLASNNRGWWSDLMAALDWILDNRPDVDLINMSLGGGLYSGQCDDESSLTASFANLIGSLRTIGITTFVSAGNDASPTSMQFPACLSGVISVGATDDLDEVASFSNTNLYTDLLAPGVSIVADVPGGGVAAYSGTSMATPHALGCAALQIQAGRATTPGSIEAWLKGSGVPVVDSRNGLTFPRIDCFAEPTYEPPGTTLLAVAGPPDSPGGCGGTGAYQLNVIGGTITRTGDTEFVRPAVGYSCWKFDQQYTRVYVVADDPATFDHWESPSGNINLIDGHMGTSTTTIETSFNLLGKSPTFKAIHTGGDPTPDLLRVDRLTGIGSLVGPLSSGLSAVYPAIAEHPTTDVLFAAGGNGVPTLHTVNKATGALSVVGPAGAGITRIGAMDFRSDGTLFASVKVGNSGGTGATHLATLNTSTGVATLVGSFGSCTTTCSIEGMEAIAFDPGDILYGAVHERALYGAPGLYTINTSNGGAAFVGPIVDNTSTPPSGGIASLQFQDGVLFGGTAMARYPPGDGGWLVTIDETSGAYTKIGAASATGGRGLIALAAGPPGAPPENDDLSDATIVGPLPYAVIGNTANATAEPSEAFGSCASDHGSSVWWSFTAPSSGPVEINTNGSSINTALSIWTGSGHPLVEVDCDDNSGAGSAARIVLDAASGTRYFIRVIGVADATGSIHLNVTAPSMPNDDLVNATPVGPRPSSKIGTNVGATQEPLEQTASCGYDVGNSVWWSFISATTGPVTVNTEGSSFDTVLGVWTGAGHPLTQIACNDDGGTGVLSSISFQATAGVTYYFRVTGFGGAEGNIVLNTDSPHFTSCNDQSQIPAAECAALVALFDSTGGSSWGDASGWLDTVVPCYWYGVACSSGHVVGVDLGSNGLAGSIPGPLANLSNLQNLSLPDNGLTGSIPSWLGNLTGLTHLDLGDNALTGTLPTNLGSLTALEYLSLQNNLLTGEIPTSLGNLSALDHLLLGSNQLGGTIPIELGNLSSLTGQFDLQSNDLEGTVPLAVATVGSGAGTCRLADNAPSLCMPQTPAYNALATGGAICSVPLDPLCTVSGNSITLIRDIVKVPDEVLSALDGAGSGLTQPVMDSLLTSHLDVVTQFTVRGVVLTDPLESGLATWDAGRGGPTRVHFFVRDPAADSLGKEAMGLQIVDASYETNGTLSLVPGDVVEATGHLVHFNNLVYLDASSIVDLGHYSGFGLTDAVIARDTVTSNEVNQGLGPDTYQANWSNYNALHNAYVCIKDATLSHRTVTGAREDWAITTDGGVTGVTTYDASLRYRNDRNGSYQAPFDVLTSPFVPPTVGSVVTVCGTVVHQSGNDPYGFAMPADATLSLNPWADDDLTVVSMPPVLQNLVGPASVPGDESVQIMVDAFADDPLILSAVKLMFAVGPSPTVVDSISMSVSVGDTYEGSIPSQGDGAIVRFWVEATDSGGKKSKSEEGQYRHLFAGIKSISDIQQTFDLGEGDSPLAGFTTVMDVTATVQSDPAVSGFIAIQDDGSVGPWSGILVTPNSTLLADLNQGDEIHITFGTISETSGVTTLSDITYDKLVSKAAVTYPYKTVSSALLKDAGQAEAFEGMLVQFNSIKIVAELSFGEWEFTNGTDDDQVLGDGASASFPDDNSFFDVGDRRAFLRGIWWYSFGTFKLVPEDASDVGDPEVAAEGKVLLQGPFAGGIMHIDPTYAAARVKHQPYSDSIFDGTALDYDSPDSVASLPDSLLDWVLVSLRSDVTPESEVPGSQRAALLLANGSIVDTTLGPIAFPGATPGSYYLVVRHRNHASVMSSAALDLSSGQGTWDFTTGMSQAYSAAGDPMKDLGNGKFGLFACDANADGFITAPDFNLWNAATSAGAAGYEPADCNLDGIVTAPDFNLWNANTSAGASSKVPD